MKLSAILAPLLDSGTDKETILAVVRAFEDEQAKQDDPLEKRRANDRERLRRYKERRALPDSEWLRLSGEVYRRDGKVCHYCDDTTGPFHIDHYKPVSQGGSNALGNLVVACQSCNSSKSGLTYEQWRGQE